MDAISSPPPHSISDAGPGVRGTTFMGPASENLHITGSQLIYRSLRRRTLPRQSISALWAKGQRGSRHRLAI